MKVQNELIKTFFILYGSMLVAPLQAMEKEDDKSSLPVQKSLNNTLTNGCQHRADVINREIKYRLSQNTVISIAGCTVHRDHLRHIAPLVDIIYFLCSKKISSDTPENKLIPYVTNLIGNFAQKQYSDTTEGLLIIPEIKTHNFHKEICEKQIKERNKERLEFMAHEISQIFTEEDLNNYVVKKTDFQITKPKRVSLCNRESISNEVVEQRRSTRNFPTTTKDPSPNLLYKSDEYSTIIKNSKDTDRHSL